MSPGGAPDLHWPHEHWVTRDWDTGRDAPMTVERWREVTDQPDYLNPTTEPREPEREEAMNRDDATARRGADREAPARDDGDQDPAPLRAELARIDAEAARDRAERGERREREADPDADWATRTAEEGRRFRTPGEAVTNRGRPDRPQRAVWARWWTERREVRAERRARDYPGATRGTRGEQQR